MYKISHQCRICCNSELKLILSLGDMPLVNSFLEKESLNLDEPRYPLELFFCNVCSLVQITQTVPQEKLFTNYLYYSSFSDTFVNHSKLLVESLIKLRDLNDSSQIIEIGSNDGYLLQFYNKKNIPVLGIEPAKNIAKVASDKGINTLCGFFNLALAEKLVNQGVKADVIHANNVFAHVNDLQGFVLGIKSLLKEDGIAIIEVPYVKDLIENVEFDTIYHEHLCYFSVTALRHLFEKNNLFITNVEHFAIHGGTIRLTVTKNSLQSENLMRFIGEEKAIALDSYSYYEQFERRVTSLKRKLQAILKELKDKGAKIAAYGASAKGCIFLNYFNIGKDYIDSIFDRNTFKQGLFMPGVHIPIINPDKIVELKPDYILLLSWNFKDEIVEQQKEYINSGGHFIVPIPKLEII